MSGTAIAEGERIFVIPNCAVRQEITISPMPDGKLPMSVQAEDCPSYEKNDNVPDGLHAHTTIELELPTSEDGMVCRVSGCIHYISQLAARANLEE